MRQIPAKALCGRCKQERRVPGQYYGKKCKAEKQREFRERRRRERAKLVKRNIVPARVS
jgi:hypothetical protein